MVELDPVSNYVDEIYDGLCSDGRSTYFTVNQNNDLINSQLNFVTIIKFSVRSYNANSDALFCILFKNLHDIIILTETWFTENTTQNIEGFEAYSYLNYRISLSVLVPSILIIFNN